MRSILATPSPVTARLLEPIDADSGGGLGGDRALGHGHRFAGLRRPADRPSAGRHGRGGAGHRAQPDPGGQFQQPEVRRIARRRGSRCCGCSWAGRGARNLAEMPDEQLLPLVREHTEKLLRIHGRAGVLRHRPLAAARCRSITWATRSASPGSAPARPRCRIWNWPATPITASAFPTASTAARRRRSIFSQRHDSSGRVGEGPWGRLSPHQTGRADFPHPAYPVISAQAFTGHEYSLFFAGRNTANGRSYTHGCRLAFCPVSISVEKLSSVGGDFSPSGFPFRSWKRTTGRGPSLHGRYPASSLLCPPPTPGRTRRRLCVPVAGRGGFARIRPVQPGLSGSRLVCQRPPSPTTPESPTDARARCFSVGDRLHHFRKAGHSRLCNEAGTGSRLRITADIAVSPGFARQVALPHAGLTSR